MAKIGLKLGKLSKLQSNRPRYDDFIFAEML